MNRRQLLKTATIGLLGAGSLGRLVAQNTPSPATKKPNIIIILSDDAGYADFSMHGSKQFPTPNIDTIAKNGIRFQQGYVTESVCSPSRAGLLTGRNQQRFGHETNLGGTQPSDNLEYYGLREDQVTIADALKTLGYHSIAIGKWHLGHADKFHPCNRGFDEFYGFRGGGSSYWSKNLERNLGKKVPIKKYMTDELGDEACRFMRRNKDKPFFIYLCPNAVHTPMHATKEDMDKFPGIDNKGRRTLAGMTLGLDRMVGNVMSTLRELKLEENTLVFFLNDNGGTPPCNRACNAPLNGMKGTLLEGGVRVPFAVQWPGKLPKSKVYPYPVSSLDLFATTIAAAGGEGQAIAKKLGKQKAAKIKGRLKKLAQKDKHNLDGVNLLPYLTGKNTTRPHQTLYWRRLKAAAIRDGDWKLIRLPDRPPMLFDISKDISEQNNLATKHPEKVKELLKKLFAWETELAHPMFRTGTNWIKNNIGLYDKEYILTQPK